jgi:hypothetical protein
VDAGAFSIFTHSVKKHGFSNAAETHEHGTLGRPPDTCSFERNSESGT